MQNKQRGRKSLVTGASCLVVGVQLTSGGDLSQVLKADACPDLDHIYRLVELPQCSRRRYLHIDGEKLVLVK